MGKCAAGRGPFGLARQGERELTVSGRRAAAELGSFEKDDLSSGRKRSVLAEVVRCEDTGEAAPNHDHGAGRRQVGRRPERVERGIRT